jgi:anti-sigma regulatory factor (Ser/Thr protein kinase)
MPPAERSPTRRIDGTFQTSFPARSDALVGARRAFADWLCRRADDDVTGELEIVFSELAANAVDASPGDGDQVTGRAWCDGPDLVLDLTNRTDPRAQSTPQWDLDDPLRTGGRGLVIAEALVDSVEFSRAPGQRFVVRCRRRIV